VEVSTSGIRPASIVWTIVVQFIALSMGRYLAGGFRSKWASILMEEVYSTTAHGFLDERSTHNHGGFSGFCAQLYRRSFSRIGERSDGMITRHGEHAVDTGHQQTFLF
jgi:hypothetical protein